VRYTDHAAPREHNKARSSHDYLELEDEVDSGERKVKDALLRASSEFFSSGMVRPTFFERLEKKFIKEASTIPFEVKEGPLANSFLN